jgi:hypothetical protein
LPPVAWLPKGCKKPKKAMDEEEAFTKAGLLRVKTKQAGVV